VSTVFLTEEDLRELGDILGVGPVRDAHLLASCAGRPTMTMFGDDLFPGIVAKAAALLHGIITSHPLVDGNKRLGWFACVVFCRLNGFTVDGKDDEIFEFVMNIAAGRIEDHEHVARRFADFVV